MSFVLSHFSTLRVGSCVLDLVLISSIINSPYFRSVEMSSNNYTLEIKFKDSPDAIFYPGQTVKGEKRSSNALVSNDLQSLFSFNRSSRVNFDDFSEVER